MWPKQSEVVAFYGNPDSNRDGRPDASWESANLTRIVPPYPMFWSWNDQPVKSITLHNKCADAFLRALKKIGQAFTPEQIHSFQLNQCGGGYNFRLMRGSSKLSMHSYGCALDLAPELNWLGRTWAPGLGMMPEKVVKIFAEEGINWGGKWGRPDAMHFECVARG